MESKIAFCYLQVGLRISDNILKWRSKYFMDSNKSTKQPNNYQKIKNVPVGLITGAMMELFD